MATSEQPATGMVPGHGIRLRYRDWGGPINHAASDPTPVPLLLVHGLGATARVWDLVAPLLARERRVVAVDQRGHGLSDKPDSGYDMATLVADNLAAADALGLGERFAVAGHSWGAHIAVALAADRPAHVAALILVDGGFGSFTLERQQTGLTWEQVRDEALPQDYDGISLEKLLELARAESPVWSPELEAIELDSVEVLPDRTIRRRLSLAHVEQIMRATWEHDELALFGAIRAPVLYVLTEPPGAHARLDQTASSGQTDEQAGASSEQQEEARAALERKRGRVATARPLLTGAPCVEVEWMADTIHNVPLHRPEVLAARMSAFLAHPCRPPGAPPEQSQVVDTEPATGWLMRVRRLLVRQRAE